MNEEKPPLGLRPKYVVDQLRIQEILEAIARYNYDHKQVPSIWIEELKELCESHDKWKERFVP